MGVALTQRPRTDQLDDTRRESTQTARIPLIGVDAGAIPGTKPGCSAAELERNARDIVRSRMALARRRLASAGKS